MQQGQTGVVSSWGWPPCPHPGGQMLSGGPIVAGTAKFSRPKCTAALHMLGLHRPKPGCARLWLSLRFRSYISLSGTCACCQITKCGPQRAAERVLVSEFLRAAPPPHVQCCTSRTCSRIACGACGRGAARCKLGARVRQITEMTLQGWQELAFCSELLWPPPPPHVQCCTRPRCCGLCMVAQWLGGVYVLRVAGGGGGGARWLCGQGLFQTG